MRKLLSPIFVASDWLDARQVFTLAHNRVAHKCARGYQKSGKTTFLIICFPSGGSPASTFSSAESSRHYTPVQIHTCAPSGSSARRSGRHVSLWTCSSSPRLGPKPSTCRDEDTAALGSVNGCSFWGWSQVPPPPRCPALLLPPSPSQSGLAL